MKGIAGWTALALAGLVLAAGLGLAARELSSQEVGLSAEPITVGDDLAPAAAERERTTTTETTERTDTEEERTAAQPAPAAPATPAPTDDKGGEREGSDDNSGKGSGGGGSDDSSGKGSGGGDDD